MDGPGRRRPRKCPPSVLGEKGVTLCVALAHVAPEMPIATNCCQPRPHTRHDLDCRVAALQITHLRTPEEAEIVGLTTLRKRLEKLEKLAPSLTDGTGMVPFSREWFEYWWDQSQASPKKPSIPEAKITLAQFRVMAKIARGEISPAEYPGNQQLVSRRGV